MTKSGLSPQLIMRASLARHIADISGPDDGDNTPGWQKPESQRRFGESEIENLGWSPDYAEPGYTAGPRGVLTANWNYFTRDITDILERAGFSCEWSDEWTTCDDCGKLVRTSPDSYGYQPSYVMMNDCETICHNCVDWSDYLESIEDDSDKAVMRDCNPADYGYVRLSEPGEYENGFHPSQNDSPAKILKQLNADGFKHVVFRVPETSQFYITFEVWVKAPSLESVGDYLEDEYRQVNWELNRQPDNEVVWDRYDSLKAALQICREIEVTANGLLGFRCIRTENCHGHNRNT